MSKLFAAIRKFFFAVKVMVCTIAKPVVVVVVKVAKGKPITTGELGFAFWRVVVWLAFLMCVVGSVGVPSLIAYLFLMDLLIVGFQTVFNSIA